MSPAKSRAQNRAEMEAEIRRLGRAHLQTHGAAGLSLRAIARDLGVVSSAVYRYVPSRDELLTALLVEAYTDLADTVEAATREGDTPRRRLLAAALAMRAWAVADPSRWALLYGSPVPGYDAPAEHTVGPGTRVVGWLLTELDGTKESLRQDLPKPPGTLSDDLGRIREEFGLDLSDDVIAAATTLWSVLIGAIGLEVFGQYGTDTITAREELFGHQFEMILGLIFN